MYYLSRISIKYRVVIFMGQLRIGGIDNLFPNAKSQFGYMCVVCGHKIRTSMILDTIFGNCGIALKSTD